MNRKMTKMLKGTCSLISLFFAEKELLLSLCVLPSRFEKKSPSSFNEKNKMQAQWEVRAQSGMECVSVRFEAEVK